jgi:hypothetical protein
LAEGRELRWEEELGRLLQRIDRRADDLAVEWTKEGVRLWGLGLTVNIEA